MGKPGMFVALKNYGFSSAPESGRTFRRRVFFLRKHHIRDVLITHKKVKINQKTRRTSAVIFTQIHITFSTYLFRGAFDSAKKP